MTISSSVSSTPPPEHPGTASDPSYSSSLIEGTTTIDFARLYKEEKRRLRNAQSSRSASTANQASKEVPLSIVPPWNYDESILLSSNQPPSFLFPLSCPKLASKSLFYQQQFLPPSFHDALYHWLLNELRERPYDKLSSSNSATGGAYWTTLPHAQRRVALCTSPFPLPLQQLVQYLQRSKAHSPPLPEINHILLNHYPSPTHGILPHTDGPAYAPFTITVSLGPGDVLVHFTTNSIDDNDAKGDQQLGSVLLHGRGSCIRFQDDAYTNARHAIATGLLEEVTSANCCNAPVEQRVVRQAHRISITLRHYYSPL